MSKFKAKPVTVEAVRMQKTFQIDGRRGAPGDWLVTFTVPGVACMAHEIFTDEVFRSLFEAQDGEAGVALRARMPWDEKVEPAPDPEAPIAPEKTTPAKTSGKAKTKGTSS